MPCLVVHFCSWNTGSGALILRGGKDVSTFNCVVIEIDEKPTLLFPDANLRLRRHAVYDSDVCSSYSRSRDIVRVSRVTTSK